MIIGITGTIAAGKGTIVEFLKERGFKHFSVREFISDEIRKRGLEVNRNNMIVIGNKIREENSPSYIAEQLFEMAKNDKDAVIESLRTVGEIEALRKKGNFILFAIDADINKRYERAVSRQSSTDSISFEEFQRQEMTEMSSDDPNKQNLSKCIALADYKFENNGTPEELKKQLGRILEGIIVKKELAERPSWDEYFMDIAEVIAKRSNCLRPHKGAIIVRNKQIISAGYNGTPAGTKNCHEGGCKRCLDVADGKLKSGSYDYDKESKSECTCCHGEENAIVHAAKHGISTDGATIYTTFYPCTWCAKMIINAGIKRVVAKMNYPSPVANDLFAQAGVKIEMLDNIIHKKSEDEKYKGQ